MDLIDEWNKLSIFQQDIFNRTIELYRIQASDCLALQSIFGNNERIKEGVEAFVVVHSAVEICHQLVTDYKFDFSTDNQTVTRDS
jgi:hypothetical protein